MGMAMEGTRQIHTLWPSCLSSTASSSRPTSSYLPSTTRKPAQNMPYEAECQVYGYNSLYGHRRLTQPGAAITEQCPVSTLPVGSPFNGYAGTQMYYLDRGNGKLTRLIPADMLPPLHDVPAKEEARPGMIVLPPLTPTNYEHTQAHRTPFSPKQHQNDLVQVLGARHPKATKRNEADRFVDHDQVHINHIVSDNRLASPKRNKIYCDKWVHEGVCAFTQQGCRFKHEMPQDESTQRSLGLFHGLPSWWKKRLGEETALHGGSNSNRSSVRGDNSPCEQPLSAGTGSALQTPSPASSGSQWIQNGIVPFYRGPIDAMGGKSSDLKTWGSSIPGNRQHEMALALRNRRQWPTPPGL